MPDRVPTYRPPHQLAQRSEGQRYYDRMRRARTAEQGGQREAQRFYTSDAWRRLRLLRLSLHPWCQCCEAKGIGEPATIVHHITPVREWWELRLELENTQSLCQSCHSRVHASS